MSTNNKLQQAIQSIGDATQQVVRYILSGFTRIFSPTKDDYPNVGIQPFEGEPADDKQ
jgi:hypothetical protein